MLAVVVPAVIISDVMMAGMSGYEFCQHLKRDEKLRGIPVILLTGENSPEDFKAGSDAGGSSVCHKAIQVRKSAKRSPDAISCAAFARRLVLRIPNRGFASRRNRELTAPL
jgi:CheY-like chemotaxis protein